MVTAMATGDNSNAQLCFRVPDEFVETDLEEAPAERLNRTFAEASRKFSGLTDTEVLTLSLRQEYMVMRLLDEGAVYSGTCVTRTEEPDPRLAIAQLTVLIKEFDKYDEGGLATVASGLKRPGEPRDVGFLELPAGQALMVAEQAAIEFPSNLAGQENPTTFWIRQLQATILFPGRRRAATFSISSESSSGWADFIEIFGAILRTVSFSIPSRRSIRERLNS